MHNIQQKYNVNNKCEPHMYFKFSSRNSFKRLNEQLKLILIILFNPYIQISFQYVVSIKIEASYIVSVLNQNWWHLN